MGGGINIGGRAVVVPVGIIPMTLWSLIGGDSWGAAWGISPTPGSDPVRYGPYHNTGAGNGDDVADAVTNPAMNKVVYAITPLGAGSSKLMYCEFPLIALPPGDHTSVASTVLDTNPSTLVVSMHPYWSPADDDLVVYRTMDDSPNECEIRTVQPSVGPGSVTSLKTISRTGGDVIFPRFNFDGSRIAYFLGPDIWVMNADGSSATKIVTNIGADGQGGLDYAWSPVADEMAYSKIAGGVITVRKIDGGGTSDTLLYNDSVNAFWGLTLYPWSPDGTALYYFSYDPGASDPKATMMVVDAVGGGATVVSPTRKSWAGLNDQLAYVFGSRVYWYADEDMNHGSLVSCALDGSNLRTEITFDGYLGSDTDLGYFVSGLYYWLNQPS